MIEGRRSTRSQKWLIGHVFFSMPMKKDTTLATEVQRTSGFIPVKTVPRLHVDVNEKNQRWYTQQATNKLSAKRSCRVLHKHLPKGQVIPCEINTKISLPKPIWTKLGFHTVSVEMLIHSEFQHSAVYGCRVRTVSFSILQCMAAELEPDKN